MKCHELSHVSAKHSPHKTPWGSLCRHRYTCSALGQLIFLLTAQRRFPRCRPLELTRLICTKFSVRWRSPCLLTCRRVHLVWGSCIPRPLSLLWHHLQGKPLTLARASSYLTPCSREWTIFRNCTQTLSYEFYNLTEFKFTKKLPREFKNY